jgi:hypothetical protein
MPATVGITFCATLSRQDRRGPQLSLVLDNGQIWTVNAITPTEVALIRRKQVAKLQQWPVDLANYKWLDWYGGLRKARTPKQYQLWEVAAFMEWIQVRAWALIDPMKIEKHWSHKMDLKKIPR